LAHQRHCAAHNLNGGNVNEAEVSGQNYLFDDFVKNADVRVQPIRPQRVGAIDSNLPLTPKLCGAT